MRKKREFVKIRKDELKQDEGAAGSAQVSSSFTLTATSLRWLKLIPLLEPWYTAQQ